MNWGPSILWASRQNSIRQIYAYRDSRASNKPRQGLRINVDKCQAVAMAPSGWTSDTGDIGFPRLPADQMARALGSQVASKLSDDLVWDLTISQLRTRLLLAQVKTTDVLQRAQVAQAIILPKLLYIGRHLWPTATRIRTLQRYTHNYVWFGRFEETAQGRAWMSEDAAMLTRREGGIAMPDLTSEFLQLSVRTHARWNERGAGLRSAVGAILSSNSPNHIVHISPSRTAPTRPRLLSSMASTGAAIASNLTTQPRTQQEEAACRELLTRTGKGTLTTRWWSKDWLCADYSADKTSIYALRRLQAIAHGSFNFQGLMKASICGNGLLIGADGAEASCADFPGLVTAASSVGDIVEIQWVGACQLRFRCRTIPFPLPPTAARSFRRLCDVIVYNYPAVLAPHDPEDMVRVSPATIDEWRLQRRKDSGFDLIWEPGAKLRVDLGPVHTLADVTAKVRKVLDDPQARAHEHDWLCPVRAIWHPRQAPITKNTAKQLVRAAKLKRGRRENEARARRLKAADPLIGQALDERTWTDIDRMKATTSQQRLKLRRMKGDRISGWDRLHERHGCPHCPAALDGGTLQHIFWSCPAAQSLWSVLLRGWDGLNVWTETAEPTAQLKQAVFEMRLPRFPGCLWQLSDLAAIKTTDATSIAEMHETTQTAWQQQALLVLNAIWRWRHNIAENAQQWSREMAVAYLEGVLRSSLRGLIDRLPRGRSLRDPRRQLLAALARGYDTGEMEACRAGAPRPDDHHILFFDGGSRGNPGPGGAGAVLVSADKDATHPRVEWSASMSYAQADTTNNRAEYWGVITGLREARARGWKVEVVGDSNLILRQLADYRPPRNKHLRPLYSEARKLADQVGVDVWQHHLRAFNKMADAAANAAMNMQASVQTSHPSGWGHTATIDSFLLSDFREWHTRHILRSAQE